MRRHPLIALIGAAATLVTMSAQAALSLVESGAGVYDSVNNVTWTSDANLFATQSANYTGGSCGTAGSTACENAFVSAVIAASGGIIHDTPNPYDTVPNSGTYTLSASDFYPTVGATDWWGAQAWVNYLNATNYGGSHQWALPTTVDSNASAGYPNGGAGNPAQSSSQLAQLFYGGLGQVANSSIQITHNSAYGLFSNVQSDAYWSGTEEEYDAYPGRAWLFFSEIGSQTNSFKYGNFYALAVSPGMLGSSSGGSNTTDGPIPLWALGALGAGLVGIASCRFKAGLIGGLTSDPGARKPG